MMTKLETSVPDWLLTSHNILSVMTHLLTITILVYGVLKSPARSQSFYLYKTLMLMGNCYSINFAMSIQFRIRAFSDGTKFDLSLDFIDADKKDPYVGYNEIPITTKFFVVLCSLVFTAFLLNGIVSLLFSISDKINEVTAKWICGVIIVCCAVQSITRIDCLNFLYPRKLCMRPCRCNVAIKWTYTILGLLLPIFTTMLTATITLIYFLWSSNYCCYRHRGLSRSKKGLLFSLGANSFTGILSLVGHVGHYWVTNQNVQHVLNVLRISRFWLYPFIVTCELLVFSE